MGNNTITMLGVGDLILNHPDPESLFELVTPVLKSADIVTGQNETPFTNRPDVTCAKSAFFHAPGFCLDPEVLNVLHRVGFNVISSAGNHTWDGGIPGIEDTLAGLKKLGITSIGIGMDIDEARQPGIIECKGTKIGFLNYNCTGPQETWANTRKPGCAYVHILIEYELQEPCPGSIPRVYTAAEPRSLRSMTVDIEKLRPHCDVLIVKFHKGIGITPILLAAYEQQISYAAIDAGADLILGEHAHILKGIEVYKGKVIFHNMGNFVCSMKNRQHNMEKSPKEGGLTPEELRVVEGIHGVTMKWQQIPEKLAKLMNYKQGDPHSQYPPEALQTYIAKCRIDNGRISRVSYLPCLINRNEQPEILKHDLRGQQVFEYIDDITKKAGLQAEFKWEGDEVVIYSKD